MKRLYALFSWPINAPKRSRVPVEDGSTKPPTQEQLQVCRTPKEVTRALQGKEATILFGPSGAGKTTMALAMLGFPLEKKGDDFFCKTQRNGFQIGHSADSETQEVQIGEDSKGKLWVDTAGLEDTGGLEKESRQVALTIAAVKACKAFHAVMVIDGTRLGKRANGILEILSFVIKTFGIETARLKVAFVFTRIQRKKILSKLDSYLNSQTMKHTKHSDVRKVLTAIVTRAKRRESSLLVFQPNVRSQAASLQKWISDKAKIIEGEGKQHVKIPMTEKMRLAIVDRIQKYFCQMKEFLDKSAFEEAVNAYKEMCQNVKKLPSTEKWKQEAEHYVYNLLEEKLKTVDSKLEDKNLESAVKYLVEVEKVYRSFSEQLRIQSLRKKFDSSRKRMLNCLEERRNAIFANMRHANLPRADLKSLQQKMKTVTMDKKAMRCILKHLDKKPYGQEYAAVASLSVARIEDETTRWRNSLKELVREIQKTISYGFAHSARGSSKWQRPPQKSKQLHRNCLSDLVDTAKKNLQLVTLAEESGLLEDGTVDNTLLDLNQKIKCLLVQNVPRNILEALTQIHTSIDKQIYQYFRKEERFCNNRGVKSLSRLEIYETVGINFDLKPITESYECRATDIVKQFYQVISKNSGDNESEGVSDDGKLWDEKSESLEHLRKSSENFVFEFCCLCKQLEMQRGYSTRKLDFSKILISSIDECSSRNAKCSRVPKSYIMFLALPGLHILGFYNDIQEQLCLLFQNEKDFFIPALALALEGGGGSTSICVRALAYTLNKYNRFYWLPFVGLFKLVDGCKATGKFIGESILPAPERFSQIKFEKGDVVSVPGVLFGRDNKTISKIKNNKCMFKEDWLKNQWTDMKKIYLSDLRERLRMDYVNELVDNFRIYSDAAIAWAASLKENFDIARPWCKDSELFVGIIVKSLIPYAHDAEALHAVLVKAQSIIPVKSCTLGISLWIKKTGKRLDKSCFDRLKDTMREFPQLRNITIANAFLNCSSTFCEDSCSIIELAGSVTTSEHNEDEKEFINLKHSLLKWFENRLENLSPCKTILCHCRLFNSLARIPYLQENIADLALILKKTLRNEKLLSYSEFIQTWKLYSKSLIEGLSRAAANELDETLGREAWSRLSPQIRGQDVKYCSLLLEKMMELPRTFCRRFIIYNITLSATEQHRLQIKTIIEYSALWKLISDDQGKRDRCDSKETVGRLLKDVREVLKHLAFSITSHDPGANLKEGSVNAEEICGLNDSQYKEMLDLMEYLEGVAPNREDFWGVRKRIKHCLEAVNNAMYFLGEFVAVDDARIEMPKLLEARAWMSKSRILPIRKLIANCDRHFGTDDTFCKHLRWIYHKRDSAAFQKIWQGSIDMLIHSKNEEMKTVKESDVISKLLPDSKKCWQKLAETVWSGSMNFKTWKHYFADCNINREMHLLGGENKQIQLALQWHQNFVGLEVEKLKALAVTEIHQKTFKRCIDSNTEDDTLFKSLYKIRSMDHNNISMLEAAEMVQSIRTAGLQALSDTEFDFITALANKSNYEMMQWLLDQKADTVFEQNVHFVNDSVNEPNIINLMSVLEALRNGLKKSLYSRHQDLRSFMHSFLKCVKQSDSRKLLKNLKTICAGFPELHQCLLAKEKSEGVLACEKLLKVLREGVVKFSTGYYLHETAIVEFCNEKSAPQTIESLVDALSHVRLTQVTEALEKKLHVRANRERFEALLSLVTQMQQILVLLHSSGHFHFQTQYTNAFELWQPDCVTKLKHEITALKKESKDWKIVTRKNRIKFYCLNFFTIKQILKMFDLLKKKHTKWIPPFSSYNYDPASDFISTCRLIAFDVNEEIIKQTFASKQMEFVQNTNRWAMDPSTGFLSDEKFQGRVLWAFRSLGLLLRELFEKKAIKMNLLDTKRSQNHIFDGQMGTRWMGKLALVETRSQRDFFRTLLLPYRCQERIPEPSEILFCRTDTTLEEIQILLYRFFFAGYQGLERQILTLASIHLLPYTLQTEVADVLEELISSFGIESAATLVLLSDDQSTWLGNRFSRCKAKIPEAKRFDLQNFARSKIGLGISAESRSRGFVKCVMGDNDGSGKTDRILQDITARMETCANLVYHKIPFCTGFPLIKLLKKSEEGKMRPKAIHLDFGRVSDEHSSSVIFSLLFLGIVKDSMGCIVYPRRTVDIYYIEVSAVTVNGNPTLKGLLELVPTEETSFCRERFSLTKPVYDFQTCRFEMKSRDNIVTTARILRALRSGCVDAKHLDRKSCTRILPGEAYDLLTYSAGSKIHSYTEAINLVRFLERGFRGIDADTGYFLFAHDHEWVKEDGFSLPEFRAAFCRLVLNTSRIFAMRSIPRGSQHLAQRAECMRKWREMEAHPIAIWYNAIGPEGNRTPDGLDILCKSKGSKHSQTDVIGRYLSRNTIEWLKLNKLDLDKNWHSLKPLEFYKYLRKIDGWSQKKIDSIQETGKSNYCMTFDNFLKMIQITLRLHWGVPVVIMGETGCGKSALIKNLMDVLQVSLKVLNVHGGLSAEDIRAWILESINSHERSVQRDSDLTSKLILFFDEVNTSPWIDLFKEVICDRSIGGRALPVNVRVIAACNPYRLKREAALQLGRIGVKRTFGGFKQQSSAELRSLVYRVHRLPDSILDNVYDFGSLSRENEVEYLRRMVRNVVGRDSFDHKRLHRDFSDLLEYSQEKIRELNDNERSAASLRDVMRCCKTFLWTKNNLIPKLPHQGNKEEIVAMIVALAYSFYFRLNRKARASFARGIKLIPCFKDIRFDAEVKTILELVVNAKHFKAPPGIVYNEALTENLFTTFCSILQKIPIFIVGKPGSSKTLALRLIRDNMKGTNSESKFLKHFPRVVVFSYQCSPLSTSHGVEQTYTLASQFLNSQPTALAVVLLDEVGLAEFSPHLPLKVLHKVLDEDHQHTTVGISNWPLDPAKMNRAVHLYRPSPCSKDLKRTAEGMVYNKELKKKLGSVARACKKVFELQPIEDFWGLRDFYNLVKFLDICISQHGTLHPAKLKNAILRNFGGIPEFQDKILKIFFEELSIPFDDTEFGALALIRQNLTNDINMGERKGVGKHHIVPCRHLMVVTTNGAALPILFDENLLDQKETCVIMSSDFPDDKTDHQVFHKVQIIKHCMAAGKTVVLYHCDNLFESLYDLLNQHYTSYGGDKQYARLAFGAHSEQCEVHSRFKIVVVVEACHARETLDPPLLNRFEKQILEHSLLMTEHHKVVEKRINNFVQLYSQESKHASHKKSCRKSFVGFHGTMLASLVLSSAGTCQNSGSKEHLVRKAIESLLWISPPEAICKARGGLTENIEGGFGVKLTEIYLKHQSHENFVELFISRISSQSSPGQMGSLHQVTTFSLFSRQAMARAKTQLRQEMKLHVLHEFSAQTDFQQSLRSFFEWHVQRKDESMNKSSSIFILQCDPKAASIDRIRHAKHTIQEETCSFFARSNKMNWMDHWKDDSPEIDEKHHPCGLGDVEHARDEKVPTVTRPVARETEDFQSGKHFHIILIVHLSRSDKEFRIDFDRTWNNAYVDSVEKSSALGTLSITDLMTKEIFIRDLFVNHTEAQIHLLFLECFRPALGKLIYPFPRSTKMIQKLTSSLVHGFEKGNQFAKLLRTLVEKTLKKSKEKLDVHGIASNNRSLNLHGTFLEAVHAQLFDRVVDILALLFSHMERNFGLQCYSESLETKMKSHSESLEQKKRSAEYNLGIWESLCEDFTQQLILSEDYNVDDLPHRFTVTNDEHSESPSKGGLFRARFPYSFYVFNFLKSTGEKIKEFGMKRSLRTEFNFTFKALKPDICENLPEQILRNYCHDFVHMHYPAPKLFDRKFQVAIFWNIILATTPKPLTLPSIHEYECKNEQILKMCFKLCEVNPTICGVVKRCISENEKHLADSDFRIILAKQVIDTVKANKGGFIQSSSQWYHILHHLRAVFLGLKSKTKEAKANVFVPLDKIKTGYMFLNAVGTSMCQDMSILKQAINADPHDLLNQVLQLNDAMGIVEAHRSSKIRSFVDRLVHLILNSKDLGETSGKECKSSACPIWKDLIELGLSNNENLSTIIAPRTKLIILQSALLRKKSVLVTSVKKHFETMPDLNTVVNVRVVAALESKLKKMNLMQLADRLHKNCDLDFGPDGGGAELIQDEKAVDPWEVAEKASQLRESIHRFAQILSQAMNVKGGVKRREIQGLGRAMAPWFANGKKHAPILKRLLLKLLVEMNGLSGLSQISRHNFIEQKTKDLDWFRCMLSPFRSTQIKDHLDPFKNLDGYSSFADAYYKEKLTGDGMNEFDAILSRDKKVQASLLPGLIGFVYRISLRSPDSLSEFGRWLNQQCTSLIDWHRGFLDSMIRSMQQRSSLLAVDQKSNDDDLAVARISAHILTLVINPTSCGLTKYLRRCVFHPEELKDSWIPCMVDDLKAETARILGSKLGYYTCPNGHMYCIGECTQAWQEGKCFDCGAPIGGTKHNLLSDNKTLGNTPADTSPKGYCFSRRSSELSLTHRQMKPENFRLLRFLTHCALSLGPLATGLHLNLWHVKVIQACNRDYMSPIANQPSQLATYLKHQTREDWKILRNLAADSTGGNSIFLQCRIHAFLQNPPPNPSHVNGCFPTLAFRNTFEINFQESSNLIFLRPAEDPKKMISKFVRSSDVNFNSVLSSSIRNPLWIPRKAYSGTRNFKMDFEKWKDRLEKEGKNFPILSMYFINKEELHGLAHLPDVLSFQRQIVSHCNWKKSSCEASEQTLAHVYAEFERSKFSSKQLKNSYKGFALAWNWARSFVKRFECADIGHYFQMVRMDPDRDEVKLKYLLPQEKDVGIPGLAMTKDLIDLHNRVVEAAQARLAQQLDLSSPVSGHHDILSSKFMTSSHAIRIDERAENDFNRFISLLEDGMIGSIFPDENNVNMETLVEKRFEAAEIFLAEQLVGSKPVLHLQVPLMHYIDQCGELEVGRLSVRIPQKPLSHNLRIRIEASIENKQVTMSALRLIEICIRFILSTGGEFLHQLGGNKSRNTNECKGDTQTRIEDQKLSDYMVDVLHFREDGEAVPDAVKDVQLGHLQGLWELLFHPCDHLHDDYMQQYDHKMQQLEIKRLKRAATVLRKENMLDTVLLAMKYFVKGKGHLTESGEKKKEKLIFEFLYYCPVPTIYTSGCSECTAEVGLCCGETDWFNDNFPQDIKLKFYGEVFRIFEKERNLKRAFGKNAE